MCGFILQYVLGEKDRIELMLKEDMRTGIWMTEMGEERVLIVVSKILIK